MRIIRNPFAGHEGYDCFGCCPDNPRGLRLEFREEDGGAVSALWNPDAHFQGFSGVIHGGLQATAMDEVAGWLVMTVHGTMGVTKTMNVEYLKPTLLANVPLAVRAVPVSRDGRIAVIDVSITDRNGDLCTSARMEFFLYSEELAKKKLHYPGKETFFGNGGAAPLP